MLNLEMDRRTTAEQAADAIRNEILSGSIKDGDEIIQEQLAKNLGLSRMPVREALRQLESEGLIERMDNRRTRVIGVTPRSVKTRTELLAAITKLAIEGVASDELSGMRSEFGGASSAKMHISLHERIFQQTSDRFARQMYYSVFAGFLGVCLRGAKTPPDAKLLLDGETARYYGALNDAINGSDER